MRRLTLSRTRPVASALRSAGPCRCWLLGSLVLIGLGPGASSALAAELSVATTPRHGAVLGAPSRFVGNLAEGGAPLAGQPVTLEARPAGSAVAFTPVATQPSGADGHVRFGVRFDRNREVRLAAPAQEIASAAVVAFVFPLASTTVRSVGPNRVRITQLLRVPPDVELTGTTRLYVGARGARGARFSRAARPKRRKAGVYRARATVRVPARYRRRFSYAACLRVGAGNLVGDHSQRCPARTFRF